MTEGPDRFLALPLVDETWTAGSVAMNKWVVSRRGRPLRPDAFLVVCDDEVLGVRIVSEGPGPAGTMEFLEEIMRNPLRGEPRRPRRILVGDEGARFLLEDALEKAGIEVETGELEDFLAGHMREIESFKEDTPPLDGLTEIAGVGRTGIAAFFKAAATFHRAEPWSRFVDGEPFEASCESWTSSPWFATVMGSVGDVSGLALHPNWRSLLDIFEGGSEDVEPNALALAFGDRTQIPFADLDAVSEFDLEVDGAHGYPLIFRSRPGEAVRRPSASELEVMEGCLLAFAALSLVEMESNAAIVEVETRSGRRRIRIQRKGDPLERGERQEEG